MNDSDNPAYLKGYKRGRAKTEAEVREYVTLKARREKWNEIYVSLLPTALTVTGWSVSGEPINSIEERLSLCRSWTDTAIAKMAIF